ncbi:MAG: hypothetical protein FJZ43_03110 [Candidatus Staskawiczbacteria bacterium]|nr:hypothetical protein [Candidatus Staskawiczbacteria bacterium]
MPIAQGKIRAVIGVDSKNLLSRSLKSAFAASVQKIMNIARKSALHVPIKGRFIKDWPKVQSAAVVIMISIRACASVERLKELLQKRMASHWATIAGSANGESKRNCFHRSLRSNGAFFYNIF